MNDRTVTPIDGIDVDALKKEVKKEMSEEAREKAKEKLTEQIKKVERARIILRNAERELKQSETEIREGIID